MMSTTQIAKRFIKELAQLTNAEKHVVYQGDSDEHGVYYSFWVELTINGKVAAGRLFLGNDNELPPIELAYERIMEQR